MVGQGDRRGLRDWMAQRITALIVGAYAIFMLVYLLSFRPLYFAQWEGLFNHITMKVATVIVVFSILWHAWVGLWTVFTDYVKNTAVRYVLQVLVILLLLAYVVWTIDILWG